MYYRGVCVSLEHIFAKSYHKGYTEVMLIKLIVQILNLEISRLNLNACRLGLDLNKCPNFRAGQKSGLLKCFIAFRH